MALHVNFSADEASSEAKSFDPLPSGNYHVRITEITTKECGPNSKNVGKEYWSVEFTVQDGEYADRKVWTNVMLFEGALYSLVQLLKATGHADAVTSGAVPDVEIFISAELTVAVKKQRNTYMEDQNGDGLPVWSSEVKSMKAFDGAASSTASTEASKLP